MSDVLGQYFLNLNKKDRLTGVPPLLYKFGNQAMLSRNANDASGNLCAGHCQVVLQNLWP